ncbi:ATP phosphoribosyltransferase regulatory subunit [Mangrovicoccus algicola]|uniref:ATP phosphoribosyltransferase regulatory subunit n=1 Tax=Mangrovicoccus algicola TaxID=2771008 RepID=A0A8J6Z4E6_9RHOB|nr:ATP phosphoribosyltransferase regulatory subunit [Mangrovicoccus algicola]MBE3636611.1 ATP phosphoribosyltransferase regulatory subunit [Mangrovicoccus algicola]
MPDRAAIRDEAHRIRRVFEAQGAEPFEAEILQPADTLLDLYGEDIRARAYVTADPLRGEQMLRPDFTVSVVQAHMESGRTEARYAYSGLIFRQQDEHPERPTEYFQTGLEIFGGDPAEADAEVFATIAAELSDLPVRAVTGDIGVLIAAVEGLETTAIRKAALRRHLWRPERFKALLARYAAPAGLDGLRGGLLARVKAGADVLAEAGPEIGLRSGGEVLARLERLAADAEEPPIPAEQVALVDRILRLRGAAWAMAAPLREMSGVIPSLSAAAARMEARLAALESRGIDLDALEFEGSFGRTSLEYYDGFVFGFLVDGQRPDNWPPLASGGRYDAMTRVLGNGRAAPAVGGVIRPEQVLKLREAQC